MSTPTETLGAAVSAPTAATVTADAAKAATSSPEAASTAPPTSGSSPQAPPSMPLSVPQQQQQQGSAEPTAAVAAAPPSDVAARPADALQSASAPAAAQHKDPHSAAAAAVLEATPTPPRANRSRPSPPKTTGFLTQKRPHTGASPASASTPQQQHRPANGTSTFSPSPVAAKTKNASPSATTPPRSAGKAANSAGTPPQPFGRSSAAHAAASPGNKSTHRVPLNGASRSPAPAAPPAAAMAHDEGKGAAGDSAPSGAPTVNTTPQQQKVRRASTGRSSVSPSIPSPFEKPKTMDATKITDLPSARDRVLAAYAIVKARVKAHSHPGPGFASTTERDCFTRFSRTPSKQTAIRDEKEDAWKQHVAEKYHLHKGPQFMSTKEAAIQVRGEVDQRKNAHTGSSPWTRSNIPRHMYMYPWRSIPQTVPRRHPELTPGPGAYASPLFFIGL